jgi:hypothetical protein
MYFPIRRYRWRLFIISGFRIPKQHYFVKKRHYYFGNTSFWCSFGLSGTESTQKITANSTYREAKVKGAGGVARSRGKEGLFWGPGRSILSSDTDVNFSLSSGTPLHVKYPGGTHRIGGDLS